MIKRYDDGTLTGQPSPTRFDPLRRIWNR